MNLALKELRRRPGRFVLATITLAVLAMLLLFLGALLDGLFLGSTGAIRAQQADAFVYSAASRDSFLRSRITPELRAEVEAVEGVTETGGLGIALVAAAVPGEEKLADAAVMGYELPPEGVPEPPTPGQAWADRRLEGFGVDEGDTLLLGPAEVPVEVLGFVEDTNYLLQGALWVEPGTWRAVQNASRPDARVEDGVFQVLLTNGDDPATLPDRIDAATGGQTSTLTKAEAESSLPGTREQRSTFNQIIGTASAVVVAVVALFFALITLERTPLYAMLKAIGASTKQLLAGIVTQAVVVALIAFALAAGLVYLFTRFAPPQLPLELRPSRAITTLVILLVCSVLGGLLSFRRVTRIDPATAIGAGI